MAEKLNIGIVGAAGRGGSFKTGCEATGMVNIHAVCDIDEERATRAKDILGADETYTDYDEMLEKSDLQAVIIGTPMQFHAPQAIAALKRGISALSEVTAAVSLEEAKELTIAAKESNGIYMMAENYTYMKPNTIVRELVQQGLFGDVYYAEGEYLHELKHMNEYQTPWRRTWQTGVEGITYGTHSLGPIMQWMPGDRITRVCCEGTGVRHKDNTGKNYVQASSTMLCKTEKEALIKIRVDMLSDRPHACTNYQLQGTDGAYESARGGPGDINKIWLRKLSEKQVWHDLTCIEKVDELAEKYMPEMWRNPPEGALKAGHGGGDFFEIMDFVDAITGKHPCPIGIHESMDMTLPGLVSQQSVLQEGAWIDVPDSRDW